MGVSLIGEKEKEWILSLSSPVGKGSSPSPSGGPVTKLGEDEEDENRSGGEEPHLSIRSRVSPSSSHSQHPHHLVWSNGSPPPPIPPPLHLLRTDEDLDVPGGRNDGNGGERGKRRVLINNETRIPRSSALFSSQESSLLPHSSDKQGKGDHGNNTQQLNPISKSTHQTLLTTSSPPNWDSSNSSTITGGNHHELDPNILHLYSVHQYGHGQYGLPSPTPPPRSLNILTHQNKSTSSRSTTTNSPLNNGIGSDGKWTSRRRHKLRLDMESQPSVSSLVIPVKGTEDPGTTRAQVNHQNTKSGPVSLEGLKRTKNSVTLSVPSPPSSSILHSPFPAPDEVDLEMDKVGHLSPRTPSLRLISREAQTEESSLEALPPPPPPTRNREQRKRERRERRQNRLSDSSPFSGGHSGDPEQENRQGTQLMSTPNGIIPDSPVPPPPYSTLPPEETRRRSRVNSNDTQLPTNLNNSNPLPPSSNLQQDGSNPRRERTEVGGPLNPGPVSLPSPTQQHPLRYHFSHPQTSPHALPTLHTPSRRSFRSPRGIPYASEEEPKSCCGMSTSQAVSIRWFIIVIAGIGICSTVAGTALGAARSAGSQHLTLALLMIGVGVVLLTVSAVAWRLTANESGSSSCRAMLGFGRSSGSRGDGGSEPNRVFVPRIPPSYGRPHHPYAAMLYPDFQYRPPPPSYQASMQEYRLRLLLLERSNPNLPHVTHVTGIGTDTGFPPTNQIQLTHPPPPYRPYNQHNQNPTVRSGTSTTTSRVGPPPYGRRIGGLNTSPPSHIGGSSEGNENGVGTWTQGHHDPSHRTQESQHHRRDSSILSYLSHHSLSDESSEGIGLGNSNLRSGVTLMEVNVEMGIGQGWTMEDQLPITPEDEVRVAKELPLEGGPKEKNGTGLCVTGVGVGEGEKSKDGNLVRIVQTTDSSQVIGRDSVIVTVSGNQNNLILQMAEHSHPPTPIPALPHQMASNQVQILAHL